MTRNNESHRVGQFLTKLGTKIRSRQTISLELKLKLDLDKRTAITFTRTKTTQINSFQLELKLELHKLMTAWSHSSEGQRVLVMFL